MEQFVVYENPKDFPGKWVVRRWEIGPGSITPDSDPVAVVESLEKARNAVPTGLYRVPAVEGVDDPVIVEVWI